METEQFNIRMPKDLMQDLDIVSRLLKVNKSEWMKTKLAEKVHEEKNRLMMSLSAQFASGAISRKHVESLVGKDIADEMEFVKGKAEESVRKGVEYGKRLKGSIRS